VSHGHAHTHGLDGIAGVRTPGSPGSGSPGDSALDRRRLLLTLGITLFVLVIELVGGIVSGSMALLSDAGHVVTDASAEVLALLALAFATRPADERRTFGYYRLEILSALVNGLVLFGIAGVIAWEACRRLRSPMEIHTRVMMLTAALGLCANAAGAMLLRRSVSLNVKGAYLHMLSDVASSAAVIVGAVIITLVPSARFIDPVISMVIAVIIVIGAVQLMRDAVDVLLEAVPQHLNLEKVSTDIARVDGVRNVHDLHIWCITSGMYALSAHLVVDGNATAPAQADALLQSVKEMLLREHHIAHSTLQIESEIYEHLEHVH
jgi:cobalt-zinc-cadmium efflux system protein